MGTKTQDEQIRVITHQNLPARLPFWQTVVVFLLWDRFFSSYSWSYFLLGFLIGMTIIAWLTIGYKINKEKRTDIFDEIDFVRNNGKINDMASTYEKILKRNA